MLGFSKISKIRRFAQWDSDIFHAPLNLCCFQGNDLLNYPVVGRPCKVLENSCRIITLKSFLGGSIVIVRGEKRLSSPIYSLIGLFLSGVAKFTKMNSCTAISALIMLVVTNLATIISFATPYWLEGKEGTQGLWAKCVGQECSWVFQEVKENNEKG